MTNLVTPALQAHKPIINFKIWQLPHRHSLNSSPNNGIFSLLPKITRIYRDRRSRSRLKFFQHNSSTHFAHSIEDHQDGESLLAVPPSSRPPGFVQYPQWPHAQRRPSLPGTPKSKSLGNSKAHDHSLLVCDTVDTRPSGEGVFPRCRCWEWIRTGLGGSRGLLLDVGLNVSLTCGCSRRARSRLPSSGARTRMS
jgi:hypothetical protein